ncbi:hypothetical protein J2I46_21280 [Fibrella sp. HMF5405]|uniref:Response regulatory domain-containing protein n=2 Tax=Fibrella forsythiae TaxID=2817061 RepID=A0ABS3JMA1_9BACT|nr:hypothetical protein [Fibrella forsythiae]
MSHKAFYQTFFQTEQLFRKADDVLTFPALEKTGVPSPAIETDEIVITSVDSVLATAPAVQISDPIIPSVVPVAVDVPAVAAHRPELIETEVVVKQVSVQLPEIDTKAGTDIQPHPKDQRPATPLISQKVLILVDDDLLPSDLLFLEKILKAVHLDVNGVDLLNVHGTTAINFAELLAGKYIHHFFTFGVPFTRLNLDIMMDRYQPVRFEGITFLMADPLPAIEADVALKKKLWESLKKIFLWR